MSTDQYIGDNPFSRRRTKTIASLGSRSRICNISAVDGSPGQTFQDHDWSPLMRIVPNGRFNMGSSDADQERASNEVPMHEVVIERPFAIAVFPVTCREFAPFASATREKMSGALEWNGYDMEHLEDARWDNPGFPQSDRHPVTCVSFDDALRYVEWLTLAIGKKYRLPSEAEWEFVARAGTTGSYWWGSEAANGPAHYNRSEGSRGGEAFQSHLGTTSVSVTSANPWGICDILGNVWEWCDDTWHANYVGAPADGSPWVDERTDRRIVRGGSWSGDAAVLRCAQRRWVNRDHRMTNVGFRVALSL
jgi:formylglycine-generating enzyme required for sulfatase activity